jgi:hypothetical protein
VKQALQRMAKLRQRFGIAAPRVTVNSQIPWYWRWVGIAALLGVAAAAAAWIYDAGRRFAGFDNSQVQQELTLAKEELAAARSELERLVAGVERASFEVTDSPHWALCHDCPARQRLCSHSKELTGRRLT